MKNYHCPVCGNASTISLVKRDNLVVMQNYVYRTYDEAVNSETGEFDMRVCRGCGFAFNATFDADLLKYDENYDNLVPSAVMGSYYRYLAHFLYETFDLEGGLIIEVGCGKGAFLNILCETFPGVEALGVDPSYQPSNYEPPPNVKFIADVFKEGHIPRRPSLVICRHVLEHMSEPIGFLGLIRKSLEGYSNVPFFIEVPDLDWIVENEAFWDFCYEHCNYFTSRSLKNTLQIAGFETQSVKKEFDGQYLWSTGVIRSDKLDFAEDTDVAALMEYAEMEKAQIRTVKNKLEFLKKEGNQLAVWGMATKGVVFCNLLDPEDKLFDYCIDINRNKFGCFVPLSGHRINLPGIFAKSAAAAKLTVIVMNPNYLFEIAESCRRSGLEPNYIDASGNELTVQ
jgi:SAM-dependent methyltransferase